MRRHFRQTATFVCGNSEEDVGRNTLITYMIFLPHNPMDSLVQRALRRSESPVNNPFISHGSVLRQASKLDLVVQ